MITNEVTQSELNEDTTIVLDLWQTTIANSFWLLWVFVIVGINKLWVNIYSLLNNEWSPIVACFMCLLFIALVRELPEIKFHYKRRI